MNRLEIYSSLRELIGNPDVNDVTNKQLDAMIVPALEWLAVKLEYAIYTDSSFQLRADVSEYTLPQDFGILVFAEWNSLRLIPASVYEWQRSGTDYRNADSVSSLREFAIRGRKLILFPPPSSTAITTDPFMTIQYIGSAPMMDSSGTPQLSNLDQELLVLRAGVRYCRTHPSDENLVKIREYSLEIDELLPAARKRAQNAIAEYQPTLEIEIDRYRGAR